jgi:hypothetical protein
VTLQGPNRCCDGRLPRRLGSLLMAPVLRLRREDGSEIEAPIADVGSDLVLSSVPWRTFRSYHRQQHLSGYYWSSTTGGHVIYESRLEFGPLVVGRRRP